jgi:chemotaxis methyl-accepting protein methylase
MGSVVKPFIARAAAPAMDDAEFTRWVDLLERRTGVVVPPGRKAFLVTGVRSRMRETGHKSFADYFAELLSGPKGAIEWATLVDRLTVHQTHFFRHPPSLELVARDWLPAYLERTGESTLHAWSVGCSTGEEAYTLAMVLDDAISHVASRTYVGITATDISAAALGVGRGGVYPDARLEEIPPHFRARYCASNGDDSFAVVESLRRRVGFVQFNLIDIARAPLKRLDLIYCQNVLIYFARERRAGLLQAIADLLKPGGLLVLGAGEVLGFNHPQLTRLGGPQTLAFRRTA